MDDWIVSDSSSPHFNFLSRLSAAKCISFWPEIEIDGVSVASTLWLSDGECSSRVYDSSNMTQSLCVSQTDVRPNRYQNMTTKQSY